MTATWAGVRGAGRARTRLTFGASLRAVALATGALVLAACSAGTSGGPLTVTPQAADTTGGTQAAGARAAGPDLGRVSASDGTDGPLRPASSPTTPSPTTPSPTTPSPTTPSPTITTTTSSGPTSATSPAARSVPGTAPAPSTSVRSRCAMSRPAGWTAAENARPGTGLNLPDIDPPGGLLGYLDRGSADCGQKIAVHLATPPGGSTRRVKLIAYRIGWYGGAGARAVWRSGVLTVGPGVVPPGGAIPHLVVPAWPVTLTVTVDASWPPGFYLLMPVLAGSGAPVGAGIPLTVHNADIAAPILFKASTLTWNAYSDWGGWSLYHGPVGNHVQAVADRARVVAMQRPLTGSGYQQMRYMDLPVVRSIEHVAAGQGLDVGYVTDQDVDADPEQLMHRAEIVSGGHSEYWTTSMYDGLTAAAGAGVNLVFLGANNLWWQARLEGGSAGSEPQREVVYRVLSEDPMAATDPLAATVQWQSGTLRREPAAMLGQAHAGISVRGGLQLMAAVPDWFTAGTGLTAGSELPGAVGNEADGFNSRSHNPAHTQVFAAGLLLGGHGPVVTSVSYSTRPSGAAVFAAGSTDWACAPTGRCPDMLVPAATAKAIRVLTANVLIALSTRAAGITHPAMVTVPLHVKDLISKLPDSAMGYYGGVDASEQAGRVVSGHRAVPGQGTATRPRVRTTPGSGRR